MNTAARAAVGLAVAAAAALALWWARRTPPPPPAPTPQAEAPVAAAPSASATAPAPAPTASDAAPPATLTPLAADDVAPALVELLGRKTVDSMLQTDDFARRVVATVDALARDHAAPMLWPVNPTPGRFTVAQADGDTVIAPDNGARYTALVLLAETVDLRRVVDLYGRMYPLLQQAWRELGHPKGDFHARLLEVLDHLIATPDVESPKVALIEVKGPLQPVRPWVRYEFVDPDLEALSAGQKMLLRSGPVNARRLKAKLAELRRQLSAPEPTR